MAACGGHFAMYFCYVFKVILEGGSLRKRRERSKGEAAKTSRLYDTAMITPTQSLEPQAAC